MVTLRQSTSGGGWMNDLLRQVVSLSLLGKCVAAVVGILFIHATFRVLEQTLPRRFGRADARYRVRKFVVYCGYLAILLFLALLFEDRLGRLSFALGVAGAGVAVALQDVLASIAGAFSISFSKLYAVGDRVQIGDTRGDRDRYRTPANHVDGNGKLGQQGLIQRPDRSHPKQHRFERVRLQLLAGIPVYLGRD